MCCEDGSALRFGSQFPVIDLAPKSDVCVKEFQLSSLITTV